VPSDPDTPLGRPLLAKGRLEGFSDGVFGFAITLLVIDIAIHPPGSPLEQLLHAWPAYLAYVISFLTIGGNWLLHSAMTGQLAGTDQLLLRLNLLLLLVVVFLPFPTGLVADALRDPGSERVYVTLYGITLLAIRFLAKALDSYARFQHLYSPEGEGQELHPPQRKYVTAVTGYLTAIVIGLLVPVVAVVLYFGIAVYLVVPFREVARVMSGDPTARRSTRPGRGS